MDAVVLDGISKSFGPLRAVDGLSARVPAGCVYGFLGPNGAGKTTTIRMIMNIIRPDSGTVTLFGNGAGGREKPRIGYMPEERGLYRKMSARRALAYFGAIKGMRAQAAGEAAGRWLERVGLPEVANKKVEELSRGMHQKLQFAVTAIDDPQLLILDEPFSGLDPVNQDLMREIICSMRDEGKTVLFSTHVMHEAERLCDYILLINKGKVVVDGQLEEIRAGYKSHAVSLELGGEQDAAFIKDLPGVDQVTTDGRKWEVKLVEDGDPQDLLEALVGRVRLDSFEVKRPTLHEIFVRLVGDSHD